MLSIKTLTDDQLVASYAQGNNEAFDELLARHQTRIYNYIFMMVKDEDVANDVFQDTFAKVVTTVKQGRYTESGRFAAWLTRIARNLIIDVFRQEKSQAKVSTDDSDFDVLNRRELSDGTIEDEMVDIQIRDDVRALLRRAQIANEPRVPAPTPRSAACATPSSTCAAWLPSITSN